MIQCQLKKNQNGGAIVHVLVLFVVVAIISAASFQVITNIRKAGETIFAQHEVENTLNQIKFILSNSNTCKTRLILPGFTIGKNILAQINDANGRVFVKNGTIRNGFKYTTNFVAVPFGRQNYPHAPGGRFLGKLQISASPVNQGRTFLSRTRPLEIDVFIDRAPSLFCSANKLFTSLIGPPGTANQKSSVECLDVGGRPVSIPIPNSNPSQYYLTCFIPASKVMPSGCTSISKLWAQNPNDQGEGWSFDLTAQKYFINTAAQGNLVYEEASYCL